MNQVSNNNFFDSNSKKIKNNKEKKNSKIKKAISVIEYLIVGIVILYNLSMIIQSVTVPNKTPSFFGKKSFVIISGSMVPKIQIGDLVIVEDTTDVHVGDVVAFRKNSTIIVHRIVSEMMVDGNKLYQSKGDNNRTEDIELLKTSEIEGKYIGKVPYIGHIILWIYNNMYIVIAIVILIIIIRYIISSYRESE